MRVTAAKELGVRPGRFITLDGLRGLAALVVVCRHYGSFCGTYVPRFSYLAVDLFFIMSGFVLAHTYDKRFALGMSFRAFMSARVKRLYPLYLLGLIIGTVVQLLLAQSSWNAVLLGGTMNLVGLPSPPTPQNPGLSVANGAFWSLFFEFWVANAAFAAFWRRLQGRALWALVAICALGLLASEKLNYSMDVGTTWKTVGWGTFRVGFSFFVGVAISRIYSSRRHRLTVPSWACLLLFFFIMLAPLEGRPAHVFELAITLLVFPAIIYLSAGAKELRPWIGHALGEASYATYAMHFPVIVGLGALFAAWPIAHSLVAEILVCAALGTAGWAAQSWIDTPLRQAITRSSSINQIPQPGARQA